MRPEGPNGKKRLAGDTGRQASSGEVKDLRREMSALKDVNGGLIPGQRGGVKAGQWG